MNQISLFTSQIADIVLTPRPQFPGSIKKCDVRQAKQTKQKNVRQAKLYITV